jgi:hypothetical protein
MSIAGESAGVEAHRQRERANALEKAAAEARATADRYDIAHRTEAVTARILAPLGALGHVLLADRRWPGSKRAQVDMVVVGPGGVFIVDTKAWADVTIANGRISRGQEDVTDDIARLADLRYGTEAALAEIGLAPTEVHAVVALAGKKGIKSEVASVDIRGDRDLINHITSHHQRLTPTQVDAVLAKCLEYFPPIDGAMERELDLTIPEAVVPRSPMTPMELDLEFEPDPADLLAGDLEAPIETWMTFLDPAQAKLIRRNFNGPSRIRGAAGTGKTVVGLHRAAYLARSTGGRVLFATYIRTLPAVLRSLLGRLAPDVADRVEFVGIHAFALRVLKERDVSVPKRIAGLEARLAFDHAWNATPASSPLRSERFTKTYWQEEITHVIKGRGLTRFEEYADLARVGRKHPLTVDQRQAVWDLYSEYSEGLRSRGAIDWEDLILLAKDSLLARPLEDFSAVIVDEAQDLSCAMVSMLHSLVGDRPDGLTLIGDGQQTIYPGGYTLAEVGINLAGRGVVLDVNHRNTREILSFAKELVAQDQYVDIEGVDGSGDAVSDVTRTGPAPTIARFSSAALHDAAVLARVSASLSLVGTGLGDIGVLTRTNAQADRFAALLKAAGLRVVSLKNYDGIPVDAIKVGTIKRAKGLEFKQVLLPSVQASMLEAPSGSVNDLGATERERWELDRRELYVGMTRARDGLWVGVR